MHFDLKIVPHFLVFVQALNLVFVPSNLSIDVKAICNIVSSTLTKVSELPSKVVGLAFCDGCQLLSLMLHA